MHKFFDIQPGAPERVSRPAPRIPRLLTTALLLCAALFIALVARAGLRANALIRKTIPDLSASFRELRQSFNAFDLGAAGKTIAAAGETAIAAGEKVRRDPVLNSFSLVKESILGIRNVGKNLLSLGRDIEFLKTQAFALVLNGGGARLVETLDTMRVSLEALRKDSYALSEKAAVIGLSAPTDTRWGEFRAAEQFLAALTAWLSQPQPQHFLVLFQNQSEIRPGGGFVGSFADVTFERGSVIAMTVRDIYDPDGQLEARVKPPEPLQQLTARWGSRDANWFFDFPTSARKIISFLERSKTFSERGIRFDGAVAVNLSTIAHILKVTGPLEVAEYDLTLTGENVLDEIQREVRAGNDRNRGEPKRILMKAAPLLLERLASLDTEETAALFRALKEEADQKNLSIYWTDSVLQNFMRAAGVAGDELNLAETAPVDYLAVVEANVGGAKTDAVIERNLTLHSSVDENGNVRHALTYRRNHRGDARSEPWYNAPSTTYLQLLVPWGSRITRTEGGEERRMVPLVDYRRYEVDQDLYTLEHADAVFGKTIFRQWLTLSPGETQQFKADYFVPNVVRAADGGRYTLVYEKQSGIDAPLAITVEAPPGYIWEESNSAVFIREEPKPAGRLVISLTLRSVP